MKEKAEKMKHSERYKHIVVDADIYRRVKVLAGDKPMAALIRQVVEHFEAVGTSGIGVERRLSYLWNSIVGVVTDPECTAAIAAARKARGDDPYIPKDEGAKEHPPSDLSELFAKGGGSDIVEYPAESLDKDRPGTRSTDNHGNEVSP